jgi:7tm Odorant receptor
MYENFKTSLQTSATICHTSLTLVKCLSFAWNKKRINKIFRRFKRASFVNLSPEVAERNKRSLDDFNRIKVVRALTLLLATSSIICEPIIKFWLNGTWKHELIWKYWFLFDEYIESYYTFILWWMNWNITNTSLMFYATDMLTYGLALTLSNQFKILSHEVKEALDWNGNLSPLIKRHIELIQLVKQVNKSLAATFLLNFLVSSYILCGSAYLISTSEDFPTTSKYLLVFIVQLIQIALLCHFGSMVESSSVEIFNAVHASNWNDDNSKVKFGALMMLMQSRKPLELRAWKFVPLNFVTLTMILNTAYSYYTFLKSVI